MIRRKTKAQSIVEYLLVFGGIVLTALVATRVLMNKTSRQTVVTGRIVDRGADLMATKMNVSKAPVVDDIKVNSAVMNGTR